MVFKIPPKFNRDQLGTLDLSLLRTLPLHVPKLQYSSPLTLPDNGCAQRHMRTHSHSHGSPKSEL